MAGWQGEGRDTISWDGTIKAKTFIGDGSQLTGVSGTGAVDSVFTRIGDVVAATNDYTWAQINKATSNIADITTKSHTSLTDIGTNTHADIDTHIASSAIHTRWDLASQGVVNITNLPSLSASYALASHATDSSDPHGATLTHTNITLTNASWSNWASGANVDLTGIITLNGASGTSGALLASQGSADPVWKFGHASGALIGVLSTSGAIIASGAYVDLLVPYPCIITRATVLPNTSGSLSVRIEKDTYANYPPTAADNIAGAGLILTSTTKLQDSTLTNWTTAINPQDIIRFVASGAATSIAQASIILEVRKE